MDRHKSRLILVRRHSPSLRRLNGDRDGHRHVSRRGRVCPGVTGLKTPTFPPKDPFSSPTTSRRVSVYDDDDDGCNGSSFGQVLWYEMEVVLRRPRVRSSRGISPDWEKKCELQFLGPFPGGPSFVSGLKIRMGPRIE